MASALRGGKAISISCVRGVSPGWNFALGSPFHYCETESQLENIILNDSIQLTSEKLLGEAAVWRAIGAGWKQLYGSFQKLGVSFEWHDFVADDSFDWSSSFHPGSVEICLNLQGTGIVSLNGKRMEFTPRTGGFYCRGTERLKAVRNGGEQHQFITIEFSPEFLRQHLRESTSALHPLIREAVTKSQLSSGISSAIPLTNRQQQLLQSLKQPPVMLAAQFLWYQSKALELMMEFFFQSAAEDELFCMRQQTVARQRVKKVIQLLSDNLVKPPTLEEIGRSVGCSHFYLSRTFSSEMGMTIPQYLRQLRMEKAAELLKTGKFNVTEVALEVGYSSLSHFSTAFHETYGCCPGLYSLAPKSPIAKKR